MARIFAPINLMIWSDDDFRGLTPQAQHLYFVLDTDPGLSYCGVGDWEPKRIAKRAKNWHVDDVLYAAIELLDARMILIAEDTDEFLVRSFVRHDGVMQHNRMCVSAALAVAAVASNTLRQAVVGELKRLKVDEPDLAAWGRDKVREVLRRKAVDGRELDPYADDLAPTIRAGFGSDLAPGLGAIREPLGPNASQGLGSRRPGPGPLDLDQGGTYVRPNPHQSAKPSSNTAPEIQPCGDRHDKSQSCAACGDARQAAKTAEAKERRTRATTEAKAAAREAAKAIAVCNLCDPNGRTKGGRVCPHQEAAPMPDTLRASLKGAKK